MTSMHWFPSFGEPGARANDADPFASSKPSHQSSGHQSPSTPRSTSPSSSLFCNAEQIFSPWPHAPWKMMPSSSFSSFPGSTHSTNNSQQQQQQQQSPAIGDSSSFPYLRWKQQRRPDSSSGSESVRRHGRPPLHCRSRSDATAMTEASSSEEYYDQNGNNSNNSYHSHNRSNNSSSNLASTAFVTGSELERAMWLVGMNNAASPQYYNNNFHHEHQYQPSSSSSSSSSSLHVQEYYDNSDALAAAATAEAAVERAQRLLLYTEPPLEDQLLIVASGSIDIATTPLSVETFLSGRPLQESSSTILPDDVGTKKRGGVRDLGTTRSTSSVSTALAMEGNVFDHRSLSSSSRQQRNQEKNDTVTPVYHRYRHVGEFGNHKMIRRNSNSSKQDSGFLLARGHPSAPSLVESNTTPSTRGTPSSPTSVIAATPPASPSKPLSKYKQHILKKHSFQNEATAQDDDVAVTSNQNSAVLSLALDRPPKVSRRSQSVPRPPPILATVVDGNRRTIIHDYQHNDEHAVNTITTTTTLITTTTPAPTTSSTSAMAKLVAARRARTQSHDGGSGSSSTASPNNDDAVIATTTTMLSEIVSPPNYSNAMVTGQQYIDSDDLLAVVKRSDSMCSAASVQSTPSTTPTVRAGTLKSSATDRTTTISPILTTITGGAASISSKTSRHRHVLSAPTISPIGQPALDDSDTSSVETPPLSGTGHSASNPVSIDECGPIDVDTYVFVFAMSSGPSFFLFFI
jgi:hypothetical protein